MPSASLATWATQRANISVVGSSCRPWRDWFPSNWLEPNCWCPPEGGMAKPDGPNMFKNIKTYHLGNGWERNLRERKKHKNLGETKTSPAWNKKWVKARQFFPSCRIRQGEGFLRLPHRGQSGLSHWVTGRLAAEGKWVHETTTDLIPWRNVWFESKKNVKGIPKWWISQWENTRTP